MSSSTPINNIQLFKSVFAGREDVFAVRWEKGSKSGYMPAYFYDPYRYRVHKMNGGTFQNYADKEYLPFTEKEIEKTPQWRTTYWSLSFAQRQYFVVYCR